MYASSPFLSLTQPRPYAYDSGIIAFRDSSMPPLPPQTSWVRAKSLKATPHPLDRFMVPIRLCTSPTTPATHSVHKEESTNRIKHHLRVPEAAAAKEVPRDQSPAVSAMKSMSLAKLLPTASLTSCVPDVDDCELLRGDDLMYRRRALAAVKQGVATAAYEALQREAAFCDSVFGSCPQTSTPFLTDLHGDSVTKSQEKGASQPPPLHFTDRRPPPRLTYTQVPRGMDSYFKYCGACVFADLPRCQYCQASKLSNQHRLALPRLAGLLLVLHPQLTAKEMAQRLAKYARNDDFCAELNEKLGWEPTAQALCSSHLKERSILEEESDEKTQLVEELQRRLAADQANEAKFVAKIGTLNKELEISQSKTTHLEAKGAELTALLSATQLELERIRDDSAAQIETTRYLRKQLEEWQARENAKTPTDAAVQATPKAADVETQVEGACETIGTQTAPCDHFDSLDGTTGHEDQETESSVDHRREMPPANKAGGSAHRRRSSCLYSKFGVKKCANDRLVALQSVLDMIHEVMDKKVQNTQAALAAGREAEGLVEYVKIFWREKLGLRKLANKKVGEMIRAIKVYSKQHSRVFWFAVNLGVRTANIDRDGETEDVPWVPWIPASAFELLAKIFEGQNPGLHELLSNYKKGYCVVERNKVVNAIIGSTGVLDSAVRLNDPSTWKPASLALMMAPTAICRLVDDVLSIPEIEAIPEMPAAKKSQKTGISIDNVLDIVLGHQVRATRQHQNELTAAFHRFDDGEQGLDIDEFRELLAWTLKPHGPGKLDVIELYAQIESLADATLLDNDNDKNINDSLTFPVVIMQQIYKCPLACAANCRKWWTLDEHDRPVPAGTMPVSFHFRRSAALPSNSQSDSGNETLAPSEDGATGGPGHPSSALGRDRQHQSSYASSVHENDDEDT